MKNFFIAIAAVILLAVIMWEMFAFSIEHLQCQKYNHDITCHLNADFLGAE